MVDADVARELETLRLLGLAGLLSALIGLERELACRPAGLRTHILVGVAAALLMRLAEAMTARFAAQLGPELISVDPVRMLQAIIVGISFLGAGTIIQGGNARVEGLTTAASILLTAAIGVAVALGHWILASALSVSIATILFALGKFEEWIGTRAGARPAEALDEPEDRAGPPPVNARITPARRRAPPGSD